MVRDVLPNGSMHVDTFGVARTEHRAKLFKHAGSQAVRLPKLYRFAGQREVLIRREADRVILEPMRASWSRGFLALAGTLRTGRTPR